MVSATAGRSFVPFLRKHLPRAFGELTARRRIALRELSVVLVGDQRMSRLHEDYLSIAGPTDVLTFPLDVDLRGMAMTGEVIICVPEALRQARRRGVEPRMELLLYALHGMLHLAGFDDRNDRDFLAMHRTEDAILIRLGFEPVFHPKRSIRK